MRPPGARALSTFAAPIFLSGIVACSGSSGGTSTDAGFEAPPPPPPRPDSSWIDGGTSDGQAALCDGSPCQPTLLASTGTPSIPGGLALDATNLYWVDPAGGRVLSCAKAGCNRSPTVVAMAQGAPLGVTAQGSTVYWTDAMTGTLAACSAAAGCGSNPKVLVSGLSSPRAVTSDAMNLYWIEAGGGGRVSACPLAGCGSPTVIAPAPGLQIAVDGSNVYFTDGHQVNVCPTAGCSGAPTVLFAAEGATGIALDAANVYVTTALDGDASTGMGAILSCAKGGCGGAPIALASHEAAPEAIASDGARVYWGNSQGDADLWSCATAGCMDTPSALTMAALATSIVVDSTHVYWTGIGSVLALPK